jgi:hypothetical protein
MGCSHHRQVKVGQQDRQAVSHHDGASQAALTGDGCISLGVAEAQAMGFQHGHLLAMHLTQKNRPASRGQCKSLPVGRHPGRRILHMLTQVQAVPWRG